MQEIETKSIYINNTVVQDNQDDFQDLIYQLKINKNFTNSLIPIWELFQINLQGEIYKSDLKKYLVNVFQFLIFVLRKEDFEVLAEEECQRLLNNEQETISLGVFSEIFATITCKWVENATLSSALSFISLLLERTTRLIIQDVSNKTADVEIGYDIKIQVFQKENVEEPFNIIQKEFLYDQTIYYEEQTVRDESVIQIAKEDAMKNIKRTILNFQEVVPLGLACESYLYMLRNNDFNHVDKFQSVCSQKCQKLESKYILPQADQTTIQQFKQWCEVEKNIQIVPVLHQNLKSKEGNAWQDFHRLNALIVRPIFFRQIKVKDANQEKFINFISDFYQQSDYNIDEINLLHRKTSEKLQRQKQAIENEEQIRKMIKKEAIDYKDYKKRANFQLLKNIQTFQIRKCLDSSRKELTQQNEENDLVNGSSQLEFKAFTSKYNYLPKDSMKSFSEDILKYSNREPLQILVLGKPKTGKTTFAREFAKTADIVHIEPLLLIEKSLNRIKEFEENPPEMDDDGNPKEVLPECDLKVKESLESGQEVPPEVLLQLVNNELKIPLPSNKGFILDLPLNNRAYEFSWVDAIIRNKLNLPKLGCRYFSHIIELEHSDEEVLEFMSKHMENPETGKLYSQFDRNILKKSKKKTGEGDEEEEEEPPMDEEDEEAKKPQEEKDLAQLPNNEIETVTELLQIYNNKTKKIIQEFYSHLPLNNHLRIQPAGLSSEEVVQIAMKKLTDEVEVLRPLAVKLEGGSEKDQLAIEGQKIYRQWSPWQQIDCVELLEKGRVIQGRGDLACDYAGRVFLFENEENQQKFFDNPRKYLKTKPQLPKTYNVAIVGPRCSGKKTCAEILAKQYNWTKVDIEQIIAEKLLQQKKQESESGHQPSNFEPRVNDVHLSEFEWKEYTKGKELNTRDVWPIILHKLGYQLQKKPEGWGVEKKDDEEDDDKKDEEDKKKAAKKVAKKVNKEPKKEGDDERPKTPPVEDLQLKDIIQQIQEDGKTIKTVQGLMIIGQPMTEEHINTLKYHNIPLDRIIVLTDQSEEEPGKILNSRPGFEQNYNLETEMATITNTIGLLKDSYGEENVKEIHIGGTIEEVTNRIRTQLDPFFIRSDDETFIRVQADVNQEEEDNIVYGEYGPYCPVNLKDEGWLLPGKFDNPDKGESIEAYVQGRRHLFFGEAEQTKFKENVSAYYSEGNRTQIPPPRIMFVGVRGSGLQTQMKKLQEKFKIPILDFKSNLQAHLLNEKRNRRNDRLYNEVGFRPEERQEEVDDDGNTTYKVVPIPELEDENAEFDPKVLELELTKRILKEVKEVFINGNFFKPVPPEDETLIDPNDETMMPITGELNELLNETKKLPEAIFYLQVSDENFIQRKYDTIRQDLIDDYDAKINAKRQEKQRRKEEAAARRQKQIEEGVEEADLEPEEEEEEEDENAYQDGLNEILNGKKEELMNQKTSDQELLDSLTNEFDSYGVPVIPIQCNRSIDKVFDQISFRLKNILDYRENLLEKYQCFEIKRPQQEEDDDGNLPVDPLVHYEKSYNYIKSRYHDRNPLNLIDVPRNIEFPLIYRNRIYYFGSREELQSVKLQPLKFLVNPTFPIDVKNRPKVFIFGKAKSGKSTLSKLLSEKLQLVRIKPSYILEDFIEEHDYLLSQQAKECQRNGQEVDDEVLVELILKRVQMADCVENGWILDGFPKTRRQAEYFTQKGLIPTNVFTMRLENKQLKQRGALQKSKKFGYNSIVLHSKLGKEDVNVQELENYYILQFNNIRFLDSKLSKWGVFDQAKKAIYMSLQQRQNLARSLITDQPVKVNSLCFTQKQILSNIGTFLNFSPVALKINRQFVKNGIQSENLVYFDRKLYVLNSSQECQDFLKRPDLYIYQKLSKMDVPNNISIGNIVSSQMQIECKSHCMGKLLKNQLEKSMLDILVQYKDLIYSFSSNKEKNLFIANPQKYANVNLPDKLPVNFNKRNLVKKVAKKGDCTAYLEHHLGEKVMRVLAQLGYKRLKYPTIGCKETALKFIGISLKALNPNKDEAYRQKYNDQLQLFLKHCAYSQTITSESRRKNLSWKQSEEDLLYDITEQELIDQLLDNVNSTDQWNENDEERYQAIQKDFNQLNEQKKEGQQQSEQEKQKFDDLKYEYQMFLVNKKKRGQMWQSWDQENLLKITEEFAQFMEQLQNDDKEIFFKKFIR